MSQDSISVMNCCSRISAMGGAGASTAEGCEAISYNPAKLNKKELTIGYQNLYTELGMNISSISYASKVFGFQLSYLNISGKGEETDYDGNVLGDLSAGSYNAAASYKFDVSKSTSLGITGNFLFEQVKSHGSSSYLTFDLGAYNKISKVVNAGLVIKNLSFSDDQFIDAVNCGISYSGIKTLLLTTEVSTLSLMKFGAEYSPFGETLKIRGGLDTNENLFTGLGVNVNDWMIGASYQINRELPNTYSFSLSYKL